jgi:hypothetical protein
VARVDVDDVTVLTHPAAERALALDPLSTVLWAAFDGSTSLEALADDLVDSVGMAPDAAAEQLDGMCRWLGWHGFLAEPHVPEALRNDWFPTLDDDACPAQKMGLADAALIDLDIGPRRIRVGATDPDVLAAVRSAHAGRLVPADPTDEREIICANIGRPVGNRRPRHRVVDHWGNLLYGGRQREVATAALIRIVDDRVAQQAGGVWLATPVLERDGRVVVVHRGLDGLLEAAMPRLEREGIRRYESPFARIEVDGDRAELVVAPPSGGSDALRPLRTEDEPGPGVTPGGRYPMAALLVGPSDLPRYELVRVVSQVAVRWDQPHLDAADALTRRVPVAHLADDPSAPAAARSFGRAFDAA